MRSRLRRRSSVILSASGEARSPSFFRRASTKLSIGSAPIAIPKAGPQAAAAGQSPVLFHLRN